MRTRVTIECETCEAEISHCAAPVLVALMQASGWRKLPLRTYCGEGWTCPVCTGMRPCPECDSKAEECATCGGIGPDPFFAGPVS